MHNRTVLRGTYHRLFARNRLLLIYSVKVVKYLYKSTHTIFGDMPKKWRSANQQEKRREQSSVRREKFLIKKENDRLAKDMIVRQAALEKLGIQKNFDFGDHKEIYRFTDHSGPINQPPIKLIDGTVPPPAVTEYPEYPVLEYSTQPAFNVNVERAAPRASPQHERAAAEFRLRRAKAIMQMHVEAIK